jgi:hypothetical protein
MYHFDTLPIHFSPKPFETLTSYLSRLARGNGLSSRKDLSFFLLDERDYSHFFRKMTDLPPLFVDRLAVVTAQERLTILRTTFYPVAVALGRPAQPQPLSRFLKGAVGNHLRFCPHCLKEDRHYQLQWRFRLLKVCPVHGCLLYETCPCCGAEIPFLPEDLELGWCPSCGCDLAEIQPASAESSEWVAEQIETYQLLTGLLTLEQEQENPSEIGLRIGRSLSEARSSRGLTLSAASRRMNLDDHILTGLETGGQEGGAGSLSALIEYADFLGVSLRSCTVAAPSAIVHPPIQCEAGQWVQQTASRKRKPIIRSVIRVDDLAGKILAKVDEFKKSGKPITRTAITRAIGLKAIHPHDNPEIVWALREIQRARQVQIREIQREKEARALQRIEDTIPSVLQQKGCLVRSALCRLGDIDRNVIRRSLTIQMVLGHYPRKRNEDESCLEERVRQAIRELQARGQRLTQTAIAKKVGYSQRGLLNHPEIHNIFVQHRLVRGSAMRRGSVIPDVFPRD